MAIKKKRTRKPNEAGARGRTTARTRPRARAGRKLGPKTLFVLSQPVDMPAADVVSQAGEQGMKLTSALVHTIRSRHKGRAKSIESDASRHSAVSGPSVRGADAPGTQYPSASAFVREQPLNRPVKEVVEAAAKIGLKVTANLVRIVRHKMRKAGDFRGTLGGMRPVRRGRPAAAGSTRGVASNVAEAQFRQLVVQLGISRAKGLVTEVEQAIQTLISAE